ncbi:tRNA lysidine(34) synthetase TilS [Luteimonas sp. SDU82]|uniref:tRNA lysidine(34) synthetase TilS n=1 Tax=Luteimonas sp. SDU82 TaxID=3422592 RepID=UPI003EB85A7F
MTRSEPGTPRAIPIALPAPPGRGALLLGYSGGLDSTVLLHLLAADGDLRRRGLRAVHVHHGLHPEADAWARHCTHACRDLDVHLDVVRVRVARDSGHGLEAAARAARHAAFAGALADDAILALAHHRDDQAETFLLRALRASGTDGLAAMRAWRRFGPGWMWRPLLELPRAALLAHAQRHGLRWIEDPSNAGDAHDRNFLRHRVMPLLQARWPQADAAFARAAELQREAAALLDEGDAQALATVRTVDPRCLHVAPLAALPAPRRARVLRRWIGETGLPPLPSCAMAALAPLLAEGPDVRAEFAWHGATIRRWRALLHAGTQPPPADAMPQDWDGRAPLRWNGGELVLTPAMGPRETCDVSAEADAPAFVVRPRQGGERITLPGRRHSHALKHVLQDLGVPPWCRTRLPLLFDRQGALLAAGDVALSARFDAWLRRTCRSLRWRDRD